MRSKREKKNQNSEILLTHNQMSDLHSKAHTCDHAFHAITSIISFRER